jgi:nucleoside-diphosphate-sugar epimerase
LNILVTGANGFVGRHLVARLRSEMGEHSRVTCADLCLDAVAQHTGLRLVRGNLAEEAIFAQVFDRQYDLVFHLATIPGAWAEENFEVGTQINLHLTIRILEALRKHGNSPRLVYTSSIGVFEALRETVHDDTAPRPTWSYGTHKTVGELLLADYTRKQFVNGRTVRLPAVVARGADPSGAVSAFMSNLIRCLGSGKPITCPVSKRATCWWMSRRCAVENVLHAAHVRSECFPPHRTFTLPALRCSIAEVVDAVGRVAQTDTKNLVSYQPVARIEERFGMMPPLSVPRAEAVGFRHDGTVDLLVERALQGLKEEGHV